MINSGERARSRLQRLFKEALPVLLKKPRSRWTKDETWNAIELYFKRPNDGLFNSMLYFELECKLRGESIESPHPTIPERRGRPKRFPDDESRRHLKIIDELRHDLALNRGVPVEKVPYKQVARVLAERVVSKLGLKPEQRETRRLEGKFKNYCKALNRKRILGKI